MSDASDDALDALYAVSLDGFIAARKELATRLKRAGDTTKAATIAALPKPTVSAWAMNDLHRSAFEEMSALVNVGARLRAAMRASLSGSGGADEVAKLQREQRDRVEALVDLAIEHLTDNQLSVSEAVAGRLRTNLTTISTSGSWAPTGPGHMSKDLEPLDMAALAALLEVVETPRAAKSAHRPPPTQPSEKATDEAEKEREREARKAARAAAEAAQQEAHDVLARAKTGLADAQARAADASTKAAGIDKEAKANAARIEELERALRLAREESNALRRASDAATKHAAEAEHTADRAARDIERADAKLRAAVEHLEKLR
jgi:hypothetical protein